VLEFDYVQPALSPGQEPDETLVYAVLDPPGAAIDAALLAGHLERFFAISVFKGRPLGGEATASLTRLRDLAARGRAVAVLDPLPVLTGGIPAAGRRPRSLPAAIREAADAR
jgi:hypothetical protein